MNRTIPILALIAALAPIAPALQAGEASREAREIAAEAMLVDTHIDVPYRLLDDYEDVTTATERGEFDYPRAVRGGLDVAFMSIYVPAEYQDTGDAGAHAERLIEMVEDIAARAPDRIAVVASVAEAERAKRDGRIAFALGMENGAPLEGDLDRLRDFAERGIRYITLTHSRPNHISDSSYDLERPWRGLSPFGKELVTEMNRLGVMIDVSHVSDEAFWQVMELSAVPVLATHSSARHFTPGFERNMSDDMIRAVAENGGVVQVNFGSTFLTAKANAWWAEFKEHRSEWLAEQGLDDDSAEADAFQAGYRAAHPYPYAGLDDVLDHIDHIVAIAGIEHVGIGSDFDGVGDSLPIGLKDVADFPNLVQGLLDRGYARADIEKILGGNTLRVWRAAEAYAASD